jgi:hypothetical protein
MTSTAYFSFGTSSKGLMKSSQVCSARRFFRTTLLLSSLAFAFLGIQGRQAQARDLQGRLGLGYNAEFANTSQTNGLSRDIGLEGVVGIDTATPNNSVAALKFFRNLFYETNLNFYFTAGGGFVTANNKTGAEILSGFGAEAFIPGIESLGFSMEVGATLDNLSGNFVLKTLGVSFLNAGIHFYF